MVSRWASRISLGVQDWLAGYCRSSVNAYPEHSCPNFSTRVHTESVVSPEVCMETLLWAVHGRTTTVIFCHMREVNIRNVDRMALKCIFNVSSILTSGQKMMVQETVGKTYLTSEIEAKLVSVIPGKFFHWSLLAPFNPYSQDWFSLVEKKINAS